MRDEVMFKVEDSLWQMVVSGEKTWDFRRWDIADERIYRLAWGKWIYQAGVLPYWEPVEKVVAFENKATGAVARFRFQGLEFTSWAPGWVFIILGGRVGLEPKGV